MSTRSETVASNTSSDVYVYNNIRFIVQDEPMPSWAGALMDSVEALSISVQAFTNSVQAFTNSVQTLDNQVDQHDNEGENLESLEEPTPTWARALMEEIDMRLQKLESLDESDSWEDSSPQIDIPEEPIIDYPHVSHFVPSNDHYLKDKIDYEHNETRVDTPMSKEVNDLKEYLNEDMISSLPKTIQCINPTLRSNRIIRCFKCLQVGHIKTYCPKLIIVMHDSNPLPTNDNKKFELEDENYGLDKAISTEHVHIIHDIVLKEFASSYKRYKTFIAFPRRYKILKPIDLVDIKIHSPKLLKFSFKFQQKKKKTMFLLNLS